MVVLILKTEFDERVIYLSKIKTFDRNEAFKNEKKKLKWGGGGGRRNFLNVKNIGYG